MSEIQPINGIVWPDPESPQPVEKRSVKQQMHARHTYEVPHTLRGAADASLAASEAAEAMQAASRVAEELLARHQMREPDRIAATIERKLNRWQISCPWYLR